MTVFSIILPVYNVEMYLGKCLKSILRQSFKDFELICINDASTDKSIDILETYAQKDNRIKIITQPQNRGLGAARNTGLEVATGKYLCCVDSDDWLDG